MAIKKAKSSLLTAVRWLYINPLTSPHPTPTQHTHNPLCLDARMRSSINSNQALQSGPSSWNKEGKERERERGREGKEGGSLREWVAFTHILHACLHMVVLSVRLCVCVCVRMCLCVGEGLGRIKWFL